MTGPCQRCGADDWYTAPDGRVWCRPCATQRARESREAQEARSHKYLTVNDRIEQGIARREPLEAIAAAVGVPVSRVYRVADRMDEAAAS